MHGSLQQGGEERGAGEEEEAEEGALCCREEREERSDTGREKMEGLSPHCLQPSYKPG